MDQTIVKYSRCKILQFPLFTDCNEEALQQIQNIQFCSHFGRGDFIYKEGQSAASVFCLCWGKVKIVKKSEDGQDRIISLAKSGDVLGLRAVISEEVHTNSAVALEDSAGYFIEKEDLLQLIKNYPSIFLNSSRLLCKEIENIEGKIASISQSSVTQRLASSLMFLIKTYGLNSENLLNVNITKDDLANLANTTRVTVYRMLNDFKRKGIIRFIEKQIQIKDLKQLEQISKQFK